MPTVSIIVPVYNVEKYLCRCIDSILAQTFTDFELILVNDGSADSSGTICDEYALKDSRVKVIHQKNSGVSVARNTGLDAAEGEYIAFADSDDYVDPDYLASLLQTKADLVICGVIMQKDNGEIIKERRYAPRLYANRSDIDYAALYRDIMLYSPYSKLMRGDIMQEKQLRFPEGITWGEDGMLIADYLQYTDSVCVIDSSGYYYMKHDAHNSLTTKVRPDIIWMVETAREYCIEKMKVTAPHCYNAVRVVCERDICNNTAYFVSCLLRSATIPRKKKAELLESFAGSEYVRRTFAQAEKYYDDMIQRALRQGNTSRIIRVCTMETRKQKLFASLYYGVYEKLPEGLKQAYRTCKRLAGK